MHTDDPVKSQLLQKASQQREELQEDMKELTERTEKVLTNALIIGGALALTYLLVRGFSGTKRKRKSKAKPVKKVAAVGETEEEDDDGASPSTASTILSQVGSAIATQATVILLDLAREKLAEFLQAQTQKKSDEHS